MCNSQCSDWSANLAILDDHRPVASKYRTNTVEHSFGSVPKLPAPSTSQNLEPKQKSYEDDATHKAMSILQNFAMVTGHVSIAATMILLFGDDTNNLIKYVTPLILTLCCVTEHFADLISKSLFSVFDPIFMMLFFGFVIYAFYKKHKRAKNKTLATAIAVVYIAIITSLIATDFAGIPRTMYEDRLVQYHTKAFEHGHNLLHVLLIVVLLTMHSIPEANNKEKTFKKTI